MLADVRFVSQEAARRFKPSRQTVVVSITDSSGASDRPDFTGFRDVLPLSFVDVSEECVGALPGCWPLQPSTCEHQFLSGLQGEEVPTLGHAQAIGSFLQKHHASSTRIKVLVHCYAGASRSAAVAKWAAQQFDVPLRDPLKRGTRDANLRVMRLLDAAQQMTAA